MSAHDIVPDGFDSDTLKQRVSETSTTPTDELKRCPKCRRASVARRAVGTNQRADHDWVCKLPDCQHQFDTPIEGGSPP